MNDIGRKLCGVYENAYQFRMPADQTRNLVRVLADATAERAFGDIGYKRMFVQAVVRAMHALRFEPDTVIDEEFATRMLSPGEDADPDDIYE